MSGNDLATHACAKAVLLKQATFTDSVFQLRHAIDLANYSMMTADVLDGLLMDLHDLQNFGFFDLVAHLHRQRAFSERTFGPGARASGVIDHIHKELKEIESNPDDVSEWIDVVLLAFNGAWRAGHSPEQIAKALAAKQSKNESRQWPDWRKAEPGKAIEHVAEGDA